MLTDAPDGSCAALSAAVARDVICCAERESCDPAETCREGSIDCAPDVDYCTSDVDAGVASLDSGASTSDGGEFGVSPPSCSCALSSATTHHAHVIAALLLVVIAFRRALSASRPSDRCRRGRSVGVRAAHPLTFEAPGPPGPTAITAAARS
ncbi:MAG: hypothetical protein M3Y87_19660 [Myxococcota bacterium]|nr:hypothetical protein [Myxococcota bacterium]